VVQKLKVGDRAILHTGYSCSPLVHVIAKLKKGFYDYPTTACNLEVDVASEYAGKEYDHERVEGPATCLGCVAF
jgi:hypothetical protein